jgi:tetratricopeptide (TPR) repeat protein
MAEEVAKLGAEAGDAELALDGCFLRRQAWLTVGDSTRVAAAAAEHRALADELRQPQQQWYDAVMNSNWALFRGDFAEGERLAEEAVVLGQRALQWDAIVSYRLSQFALRRERGRLEDVEELTRGSVDEYRGYRSFRCLVALLESELGREGEARVTLDAAGDVATFPRDGEWLFCLSILAEVVARLGDNDRAAILYDLLAPYARLNAVASGEIAIGSVARYLGIAATTLAHWAEAEQHFEDGLEMNSRMGALPWVARTQRDYAEMLRARNAPGDTKKAESLLAEATRTHRELGMAPSTSPVSGARA